MNILRIILCAGRECDHTYLINLSGRWAQLRTVFGRAEALNVVDREEVDCVLLDLRTLSWDVEVLIEEFVRKVLPVVAIADVDADRTNHTDAIELMKQGVLDYLCLNELTEERLNRAVQGALVRNDLRKELLAKQKELEDFAYVAAHDLNAPLYKIRQCCDLMTELFEPNLPEKAQRLLGIAQRSCMQMNDLINDLLDYSRVSRLHRCFEALDLNVVVAEVVDQVRDIFAERTAIIEVEQLPTLHASRVGMRQLFHNLLTNAFKYNQMEEVRITIRPRTGSASSEIDSFEFEVLDNGIGIETKYQDRIFKPFERLHPHGEIPGSGLGLAICKRIVQQHGGTIWYRSNEGAGSVFCIQLAKVF